MRVFICVILIITAAATTVRADGFTRWLEEQIWPTARAEGVTRSVFDAALAGVRPDPELTKPPRQAEFGAPSRYFAPNVLEPATQRGVLEAQRQSGALARAERATGVPGRIVLAIWGRESTYGQAAIPHDAFRTLATRGYFGPRAGYFTAELLAALQIAGAGHLPVEKMKSSQAGALGQPQFMPSVFLRHAADGDGDGWADIWGSEADTIMSIARFLLANGWVKGRDWGFEVRLPASVSCALEGPDQGRSIRDWAALGVNRVSGRPFPAHELDGEGFLMLPAGRFGPAFLVTPNFYVLKAYNESDLYALFVGHLGDRIAYGMGEFRAGWRVPEGLERAGILRLQKRLEAEGFDVGGADGLVGFRTRRSVGLWQRARGLTETCYPDAGLLRQMRQ